jgi:hypothetical protein
MKRILIFIVLSISALFSQAQGLHIVKDNINCTYGIKDADGNWVVEPTYILIEEYNTGYFRMRDEVGLGIFTPKGKQLIPCTHDRIDISSKKWVIRSSYDVNQRRLENKKQPYFYGFQKDEQLVYNLRGEEVVSLSSNAELLIDSDYSIIAYDRVLRYSQFIDSAGAILIDSIQGRLRSFSGRDYAIVGDNVSNSGSVSGNGRVVNRKGELIINAVMDQVRIDSKKRDDLKLECSSLENMLAMVNGNFSLSDEGVHLYLSQCNMYPSSTVELLIPIENIEKLASSKWIFSYLEN